MTEKELRRMGRRELIEIIAEMKKNEIELQKKLDKANQMLLDRTVKLSKAGSIAEAALSLNGIFEAAQASADTYLLSLQAANDDIENLQSEVIKKCDRLLLETEHKCEEKLAEANAEIKRKRDIFNSAVMRFLSDHPEIKLTSKHLKGTE